MINNREFNNTVLCGDVLNVLKTLPSNLVDCVVTSPPYWGLRDYGVKGQFGLEPTIEEYIEKMTEVFREVRRVLKDTGTLWLNMGDGYTSGNRPDRDHSLVSETSGLTNRSAGMDRPQTPAGLKPKDLIGQPWRLAFALQADGWYLRSDIIWAKPNPMPESVTDRPTKSHEYVFLMSKKPHYFYDAEAIKEKSTRIWKATDMLNPKNIQMGKDNPDLYRTRGANSYHSEESQTGRNKRTVWTIATQSYSEAHFATFPEKLVEPCIRAGTSERGYCAECRLPWMRVVEKATGGINGGWDQGSGTDDKVNIKPSGQKAWDTYQAGKTIGWQPSCSCSADSIPGLVLDPFFGSGTTGVVAAKNGRNWLGIELNPEYIEMAKKRIPVRQEQLIF